ncbi:hypothetical protein DICPUDRAFT_157493 [Dictyostelium purpureum]|uniref:OTU domain-containing protein n=1 Tax=Dictyostelium purpureum TaxID=5786 RepID=F0ZZ99_DICPU|nr:uncharacterized protein DICPUDRAFT_157493 [Dictyostelium purpureum]EGC30731.1 hypothetical protein DICPUDRAFT_157493 [Dictyostelium purpureum]|eukprot:XP_003292742.1 hypothetical protein DICPUDRAFT_157493 [Dictyostelium purpureum]
MDDYLFMCVFLFIVGTIIFYFCKFIFNKNTKNYDGCQQQQQFQQQQQQFQQQQSYQQPQPQPFPISRVQSNHYPSCNKRTPSYSAPDMIITTDQSQQQQRQQHQQQQKDSAAQIIDDGLKPMDIDSPLVNSRGLSNTQPRQMNQVQMAEIRLMERLQLYGLIINRDIPGDGNCQMHAISDQIYGDLNHSRYIRNIIVIWLRNNKGFKLSNGATLSDFVSAASWEEYCNNMSKNGTWGDHLTLVAAAEIFKTNITIISSVPSKTSFFIEITPTIKSSFVVSLSCAIKELRGFIEWQIQNKINHLKNKLSNN